MSLHVTQHAIDRYIERVAPVDRECARAAIQSAEPMVNLAVSFGAHVVRLGSGGKVVLRGREHVRVVTVLGKSQIDSETFLSIERPACCGLCGLHCGHPIASVCTRVECPLGHHRHPTSTGGNNS